MKSNAKREGRQALGARIGPLLHRHVNLLVFVVGAAGLVARVLAARRDLNADEALHFQLSNAPHLIDVYRASLTNAHPPLFFFLLRLWRLLGSSEFFLRLLPEIFGVAFVWVAYRWVILLLGKSSGLISLVLFSLSPPLISLSAELRGYALLLFLIAAALAVFESALFSESPFRLVASSCLLSLAILTHYSALLAAVAILFYGLVRLKKDRSSIRVVMTWVTLQLGVGLLCLFLIVTHVAHLRGGRLEREAMTRTLRAEYFQTDQDTAVAFLLRQTVAVFRFLLGSPTAGIIGCLLALAGVWLLAKKREPAALLLALPFLFDAGASLLDAYPYGGTRHCSFLLLFASGSIAVALSTLAAGRLWPVLAMVVLLAPASVSSIIWAANRGHTRMAAATENLRAAVPSGSLLFVDVEMGSLLEYYLGKNAWTTQKTGLLSFWESSAGGYRVIGSPVWSFTSYRFRTELDRLVAVYHLPPGQVIWAVHLGSDLNPGAELVRRFPGATPPRSLRFAEISVVEVGLPR